jgi:hypothetical protein
MLIERVSEWINSAGVEKNLEKSLWDFGHDVYFSYSQNTHQKK